MRLTVIGCAALTVLGACAGPVTTRDGGDGGGDAANGDSSQVRDASGTDGNVGTDGAIDDAASMDGGIDDAMTDDAMTSDGSTGTDAASNPDAIDLEALARRRNACEFRAGARADSTLGLTAAQRAAIPLRHILVYVGENRSFDHYFGRLTGRPDVDGIPAGYTNPRESGGTAAPSHAPNTCISPDVPHGWGSMHQSWNQGAMDQFFNVANSSTTNGQRALYYYDQRDIPFYTWLYTTFALSDRFFSSVMGPTWPNRDYLYAATSDGVKATFERQITVRSLFDAMTTAHVTWKVYAAGSFREGCINWSSSHAGVHDRATLLADIRNNTLPQVAFIDGPDDHPPSDIQVAEGFARTVYTTLVASPSWPTTALILSYDEAGGFFDHAPPPAACRPDGTLANTDFNRLGQRIPLVIVSPWVRPHFASHVRAETASITRFIEAVHNLPALTNRDANVSGLLDMFDFSTPAMMSPPTPPAAGTGGCP